MGQEGEDAPSEPVESSHPAPSGPSTVASEPAELGRVTSSGPSTVAPKPTEIGHLAPSEPLVVPLESAVGCHVDSSEPFEPREGSKRQHADEELPGSGKLAPKRSRMMASR